MKFKVGQKVKILDVPDEAYLDVCLQSPFVNRLKRLMVGTIGRIKDTNGDCYGVWNSDMSDWGCFPECALEAVDGSLIGTTYGKTYYKKNNMKPKIKKIEITADIRKLHFLQNCLTVFFEGGNY